MTIVPVRVTGDVTEKDIAASAAFFPLVGAFQGLVTALPACLIVKILPADIAAVLAMACLILTSGGFDLDGFADTFDGLAAKSSGDADKDRAKRLVVMKDSAIGAIGVIALVMTILLKFLLMRGLLHDFPVLTAGALFFLMPAFSQWIVVPAMYHGVSARQDGLGRIFIEHAGLGEVAIATAITVLLFVLALMCGVTGPSVGWAVALSVAFLAAMYLASLLPVRFLTRRFGGLTGDHFGALTEVSQVLFLLLASIWVQRPLF